jgi:hypothetical protein
VVPCAGARAARLYCALWDGVGSPAPENCPCSFFPSTTAFYYPVRFFVRVPMAGVSRLNNLPPGERLLRGARLALVFGISNYVSQPCLPAASRDAVAVANLLHGWGYTLISGGPVLDATKKKMDAALEKLRTALSDGCTVVVYFAGHGLQGLLAPADATGM